jgi:hypothetical protein
MNIHFSELDTNEQQNLDYNAYDNPEKYWDQAPSTKKKKVSFDDILSNMNLVVNQKGVLQFMQPVQNEEYYPEPQMNYQQPQYQQPQMNYQQPYQEYVAQQLAQRQQQPPMQQPSIDPALKNSFLYNKYFKDYKDVAIYEPQIRVPKTMEEYKQMLLEDKIKELQQKKRIAEIKSTKLMFTTNVPDQSNTIRPTRNNLRSMNFH